MTTECLERIKSIADAELKKLVTHMEETNIDDADICRLHKLLKIEHIVTEMHK